MFWFTSNLFNKNAYFLPSQPTFALNIVPFKQDNGVNLTVVFQSCGKTLAFASDPLCLLFKKGQINKRAQTHAPGIKMDDSEQKVYEPSAQV